MPRPSSPRRRSERRSPGLQAHREDSGPKLAASQDRTNSGPPNYKGMLAVGIFKKGPLQSPRQAKKTFDRLIREEVDNKRNDRVAQQRAKKQGGKR